MAIAKKKSPAPKRTQPEPQHPAEEAEAAKAPTEEVRTQGYERALATRTPPSAPAPQREREVTATDIRRAREQRVWHALLHARRRHGPAERRLPRAEAAVRVALDERVRADGHDGFPSLIALWPTPNSHYRDPNGIVADYLSEAGPPEVVYPSSNPRTRTTTITADDPRARAAQSTVGGLQDLVEKLYQTGTAAYEDVGLMFRNWTEAVRAEGPEAAAERLSKTPDAFGPLRPDGERHARDLADLALDAERARARIAAIERGRDPMLVPTTQEVAADTIRKYSQLRPIVTPPPLRGVEIGAGIALPFEGPRNVLPGEPAQGLHGKLLPYPTRPYGRRPQSERYHTCVACRYGKYDRRERNYALCKDCKRIVGTIPNDLYRRMADRLAERGLLEQRAVGLGAGRGFAQVAEALRRQWRAANLEFGASAGEEFEVYPQSDIQSRRTLSAGRDGHPVWVPAEDARDRRLHPIRGRYPRTPRTGRVDLTDALHPGLARREDELMLAGDRSARSDDSQFEIEPGNEREGRRPAAAALSEFSGQRPIEIQKGTGLTKEEIFALSDEVDRRGGRGRGTAKRRLDRLRGEGRRRGPRRLTARRTRSVTVASLDWRNQPDLRHLRGHADPLFFAGPTGETLARHALAGALTAKSRDAVRQALVERDWTEALHDDAAWERRRARQGISSRWRGHGDWHGPLAEITPPILAREYSGPTGVDEELGKYEHSDFLSSHRAQLHSWLEAQHLQRVDEWLGTLGLGERANARTLSALLLDGEDDKAQKWMAEHGIAPEKYDAVRIWIDETNPRSFERLYPVNPQPRDIGDLTPTAPISQRLDESARARAAEAANWREHGTALTPDQRDAAVAEYRAATEAPAEPALDPTPGSVAVERGNLEAPREFADARVRMQAAREAFTREITAVFADAEGFSRLFAGASPATRREILEGMRTSPAALEERFGLQARLRRTEVGGARGGEITVAPGVTARSGADLATASARARVAARAGRIYVDARADYRRALRAVLAVSGDGDALSQARIEFRTAASALFADPRAFTRTFDSLSLARKRAVVALITERPEAVAGELGAAGRLATRARDPRWEPLAAENERGTATAAADAGRAYVRELGTKTRALRTALREGRAETQRQTLAAIGRHFPEAAAIDEHARLGDALKDLEDQLASRRGELARLDRTHAGLVALATEFRQQLTTVLSDPDAFMERFRGLAGGDKRRVLDIMATRPEALVTLPALGTTGTLRDGAHRYAALVAKHGDHYLERALRYRDDLAARATTLELPPSAARAEIRSALEAQLIEAEGTAVGLAARRRALPEPDLTRAAAQWNSLGDAERAHVSLAYPHLARLMARVEDARDVGTSGVGRQRKTTALKEHSGRHRPIKKQGAGIEL